jgi:hypothetical protein
LLKFSACIRAHGMPNFPNPVVHGSEVSLTLTPGLKQNPRFAAAAAACQYLLPAGKGSDMTITPADQQDYLRAAACMRAHGVPNFPDPVFSGGGGVHFTLPPGLDVKSRQVNAARLICQKLIPHGLPYSGD